MSDNQVSVREFVPKMQTQIEAHEVLRAKFPAIDGHNHFPRNGDPKQLIDVMDECNISLFVDLSGGYGDQLKKRLELLKTDYPDRFAVYFTPDFEDAKNPGFEERAVKALEQAVKNGAQGLKIFKLLGLKYKDADGKLLHVDDERFDLLWEQAGKLGVPVLIHTADPPAFFEPLDKYNERFIELQVHPNWHFYGEDYPPFLQLLQELRNVVRKHKNTTFIGAHIGSDSENLKRASEFLDECPNYNVDFSARIDELGRKPRETREFFLKYQDRIIFGTDESSITKVYRTWFRFVETFDECFEYCGWPNKGFWRISGIGLPDDVLRKIYYENIKRLNPTI
jgi:predicted TIM-barrel fold metal-dependent hydrolase